jgi:hypothetical protein
MAGLYMTMVTGDTEEERIRAGTRAAASGVTMLLLGVPVKGRPRPLKKIFSSRDTKAKRKSEKRRGEQTILKNQYGDRITYVHFLEY